MTTGKLKTRWPDIRGTKIRSSEMPFRHDAGIFRPNGVSRRAVNGLKSLNPRCFGVWGVIGKRIEVEKPNRVSAKCAVLGHNRARKFSRGGQRKKTGEQRTSVPARKKKYVSYIRGTAWYVRSYFFNFFFSSPFLGVSRQGGFENTRKKWSSYQKHLWGNIFRVIFFSFDFFIALFKRLSR
jgi:hypothetical protein